MRNAEEVGGLIDPYVMLGIDRDAGEQALRSAWRKAAKTSHPDAGGDAEHFGKLKAAPHRITLPDAPVPYSGVLETRYLPSATYIAEQVDALASTNQPPLPWWRNAA